MVSRRKYHITIGAQPAGRGGVKAGIRRALRAALGRQEVGSARVSVVCVDDDRMAALNRKYLGHRGPTDVLSFDLRDGAEKDPIIDGEIVISMETARREAKRRGHSVVAEASLYAVHGLLHLLGYDDHDPRRASKMHRVEDEILRSIKLGTVRGRADGLGRRTGESVSRRRP